MLSLARRESYRTEKEAIQALERYAKQGITASRDSSNWGQMKEKWTIVVEERNYDYHGAFKIEGTGRDESGIFGLGILTGRPKEQEKCHQTEPIVPLHIDVDVNMGYEDRNFERDNWVYDNFEKGIRPSVEKAVEQAIKNLGYHGSIVVHVRRTSK